MKKVFVIETEHEDVLSEISPESLSVYLHARRKEGTFKVTDITDQLICNGYGYNRLHELVPNPDFLEI